MERKKLIIFDFDGVIIDSWELAYKMNQREWPNITPEEYRSMFSGNIFKESAKRPPSLFSKEERDEWFDTVYYPAKLSLPIYDGIDRVIEKLAKNYTLVINSSSSEESIGKILKKFELDSYFEKVYGFETSTDKAEKFRMILEEYEVEPDECLLITDTVGDVLEAKHYSIPSLVVIYGYQGRNYFSSIENETIGFADKPADILNFIKS